MILAHLRIGDRFRVGTLRGRLVALSAGGATVEFEADAREFVAHDADGSPRAVRIAGGKRRAWISRDAEVEVDR